MLVDYSTTQESPPGRQVYMTIIGVEDLGLEAAHYANEQLDQISADELSTNAPWDESQPDKDAQRLRNCRRDIRRQNAAARAHANSAL